MSLLSKDEQILPLLSFTCWDDMSSVETRSGPALRLEVAEKRGDGWYRSKGGSTLKKPMAIPMMTWVSGGRLVKTGPVAFDS